MRIVGIIFLVLAVPNFIVGLIGLSQGVEVAASSLRSSIMFFAIGGFLLYRARQKKEEVEEKAKWENK